VRAGLVSGYSSEREALEEQVSTLEEQKEVLASELEMTRARLQDFTQATGELEARRQDVERQREILEGNAGQEAQGSNSTHAAALANRKAKTKKKRSRLSPSSPPFPTSPSAPSPSSSPGSPSPSSLPVVSPHYAYIMVPLGVVVGAYLLHQWMYPTP
jgi:hypothetical protein